MMNLSIEQVYFYYKIGEIFSAIENVLSFVLIISGIILFISLLTYLYSISYEEEEKLTSKAKSIVKYSLITGIIGVIIMLPCSIIHSAMPTQKEVLYYAGYKEYKHIGKLDNIEKIIDLVNKKFNK